MPFSSIDSYTLLWLEWTIGSLSVCMSGLLVLNYADLLPDFIHRCVKYGKSVESQDKLKCLELPKRYFYHFYSVALVFYTLLGISVINIYFNTNLLGEQLQLSPTFLKSVLNYFAARGSKSTSPTSSTLVSLYHNSVKPESVVIGLSLLIIQVTRRLYECKRVSVYSNARMNIIHYMFGHLFYIGVGLSMLAEAPGLTGQVSASQFRPEQYVYFTPCHVIGVLLFLVSSYIQFDSHRILANLRKDKSGKIYTTDHSIPRGKWFDLVSSPHYMAEIMIYLAITIVLGGRSITWWMVFCFVVINQIFLGKFNHSWYLKTFRDYPKSRHAIIPYVPYL